MSLSSESSLASQYLDLAQPRLGARALAASDEFFAPRERLLDPAPAQFHAGRYDDHGKWMDGWESRRKRTTGHDWCVVRLGVPGRVRGVDIDTSHFTGNYPPAASLEGWQGTGDPDGDAVWTPLIPVTSLAGDRHHLIPVGHGGVWSHVRLSIYPDGGVARLRVYGEPHCDWSTRDATVTWDLAALENGGWPVGWNDAHFGHPSNLLAPGRGANMGDGWETRRRREPGNDWCIIRLGHAAVVEKVEVDTHLFKGNYPDRCSLQAAHVTAGNDTTLAAQSLYWPELLAPQPLRAHDLHGYGSDLLHALGPVTHVKLNIHPDGGVSRLRVWGKPA